MAASEQTEAVLDTLSSEPRRRFTADEVLRMVAAGILHEDDRVELIDGQLLIMTPQSPSHMALKDELRDRLVEAYRSHNAYVREQGPLAAGEDSLPEPDLAVVRGSPRDFLHHHASGRDTILVVELAQSSQSRDRAKASVYARAGVPTYWLLDLEARRLEVFTEVEPAAGRYRVVTSLADSGSATLPELEASWPVASLLP